MGIYQSLVCVCVCDDTSCFQKRHTLLQAFYKPAFSEVNPTMFSES